MRNYFIGVFIKSIANYTFRKIPVTFFQHSPVDLFVLAAKRNYGSYSRDCLLRNRTRLRISVQLFRCEDSLNLNQRKKRIRSALTRHRSKFIHEKLIKSSDHILHTKSTQIQTLHIESNQFAVNNTVARTNLGLCYTLNSCLNQISPKN